jgi:hypothetical protein
LEAMMKVGDLVRDKEFGDTGILLGLPSLYGDVTLVKVYWCRIGMTKDTVTDYIEVINECR